MKSGLVATSIIIPVFNIFLFIIGAVTDASPLLMIIPCVLGSVAFAFIGYRSSVAPFLTMYEEMEEEVEKYKLKDQERSEYVAAISKAYETPVEEIKKSAYDLKNLNIDKLLQRLPKEVIPEPKKYDLYEDPFQMRKPKEPDKSGKVDPAVYSSSVVKKGIESLIAGTEKITRLTQDIIMFSDVDTKTRVSSSGKVYIEKALDKTLDTLTRMITDKSIEVDIDIEDGLYIEGVEERFVSMMEKLIDNAITYSRSGGKVYISADNVNGFIFVNVRDEGIGIPANEVDKIFNRFYRVERLDDPNPNGAGLGLSIVKQIADLMDAEIKVKSTVGHGTTFSVVFKRGLN